MTESLPTISVITPTFNSGKTLNQCLKLVREQDYPQDKIEILLGDGGSTDNTLEIAKTHNAIVHNIPPEKQHAEYNRGYAFSKASGEYALILDHDNFLPYKGWLKDLLAPLLENPEMVATTTCYYHYDRSFCLMDRYIALLGTSEPLPYYLGKDDRMPQFAKTWVLAGQAEDKGKYYSVRFEKDARKIPSLGTNGTLMRTQLIKDHADVRLGHHYPIDVMVDVIKQGFNLFGFTKNSLIHLANSSGFFEFMKRRKDFVEKYHFQDISKRRWSVVMPGDGFAVALYVFYSITFIKPLWDALRGFVKIRDVAWFIHPLMCFMTTLIYAYVVLKYKIKALKLNVGRDNNG